MEHTVTKKRLVALSDGTSMGDSLLVFQTDAPIEELKSLEEISCNAYIDGDGVDDVPLWGKVLEEKGYTFEWIAEHQHVSPFGTSEDWLADRFPSLTEKYVIENQPELGMEM